MMNKSKKLKPKRKLLKVDVSHILLPCDQKQTIYQ